MQIGRLPQIPKSISKIQAIFYLGRKKFSEFHRKITFFEKIISEVLHLKMDVLLPSVDTKIVGKATCGRAL